jgi:hypothetical protein
MANGFLQRQINSPAGQAITSAASTVKNAPAVARAYVTRPGRGGSGKDVNLPAESSGGESTLQRVQKGYGIAKGVINQARSMTSKR